MTTELQPLGVACNLSCRYCYQDPIREAGNASRVVGYDLEKMLEATRAHGQPFAIFGGEPLLIPIGDLEKIAAFGLETFGGSSLQTAGNLIEEAHLEIFDEYQVGVGISIDGPGRLNDARRIGSLEETREATLRSEAAIDALIARGRIPSVIVTVHNVNASPDRLEDLAVWLRELVDRGVRSVNIHNLEVDSEAGQDLLLPKVDELAAWGVLYETFLEVQDRADFLPFTEIRALLQGDDRAANCVWNACDPLTTGAVQGIDGQGNSSNCHRTDKEGIAWSKATTVGHERQLILHQIPIELGGCRDCRFFFACKGQCPGTGTDGDWRRHSDACPLWTFLFETIERDLVRAGIRPLSLSEDRQRVERELLDAWSRGANPSIYSLTRHPYGGEAVHSHQDATHGDSPHGDSHGDSWGSMKKPIAVVPVEKGATE